MQCHRVTDREIELQRSHSKLSDITLKNVLIVAEIHLVTKLICRGQTVLSAYVYLIGFLIFFSI